MFDIEDLKRDQLIKDNRQNYEAIIEALLQYKDELLTDINQLEFKANFNNKMNSLFKKYKIVGSKVILVNIYMNMIKDNKVKYDASFLEYLAKRGARTASGVNSFAILLSPHPHGQDFSCKHNCYYCPDETKENGAEEDMPRSYLAKEPAVSRGLRHKWDAYNQIMDRLLSLVKQGHEVDKLELILEGGTYTEYPIEYLEEYHRDIFYTANTFYDAIPKRERLSMREEININVNAKVRIIGICIETRPDAITDTWIRFFRKSGTTRIQLGVQHTNNRILKRINRGHTFEDACRAVERLKNNCFKIDIHLMPDLPYATPQLDKEMFDIVYNTPMLQPDQLKIYPCQVVPYTVIKRQIEEGKYRLYSMDCMDDLKAIVRYGMETCQPYMRISRVVRDIPLHYISDGNPYPNLRQMLTDELTEEDLYSPDIRAREITRHPHYNFEDSKYKIRRYHGGDGIEYFISLESVDSKAIFGFCRLRIAPKDYIPVFSTLYNKGLIRELHVYNKLVPVGKKGRKTTQHRGVGKSLLKIAEWISWTYNLEGVAVITGEGVRQYYHKQGYKDEQTFAVKYFKTRYVYVVSTIIVCLFCMLFLIEFV
jgi:ELP3 family radical SAM enzyme/protein acetyltransferase